MSKWRSWTGALSILALVLVACAGPGSAVRQGVNEGNQAPNFTLETLDGQQVSLEDYRGRVVLVNIWATWCAPCRAEVPDLEAAYQAHQGEGFVILGVNMQESPQDIERFLADLAMTYPILLDERGQVIKTFRAIGLPMSILVDREGVIQVRHTGLLTAEQLDAYLARLLP